MQFYPAIDLQSQQCVRLYQGQFSQSTRYDDDPYRKITEFAAQGTTWCHVVDLDGAQNPEKNQSDFIENLIHSSSLSIQTGGGIRHEHQIEKLLKAGAKRIVIGSKAVLKPYTVKSWIKIFGADSIVIAFDIKIDKKNQPTVFMHGWQTDSQCNLKDLIQIYLDDGLKHIICTDITKDGTLKGPNFDLYEKIKNQFPMLEIQASGGISSIEDLKQLKMINTNGAILGKALYEKKFTLKEALVC